MPSYTILFSGMMAGDPYQGGATWAVLQYVLGLQRLGHTVLFVEPVRRESLKPQHVSLRDSDNASYFRQVVQRFGLEACAALLLAESQETVGMDYAHLHEAARQADLLINVSGMLTDPELLAAVPVRVYLDLDPAFIQLWHQVQQIDMRLDAHTHFVTVGQAIGRKGCSIPTCGKTWMPTLQPVVLDAWPVSDQIRYHAFTTIANWRGYGSIHHRGLVYGQKAHSLRRFMTLPRCTPETFSLALSIHPDEHKDLAALAENNWDLLDPVHVAGTPERYRRFIQGSKAELGIAKSGYIVSRCGWFSDRSACYLASGKPVLAQDTGFSAFLPTGEGLFAFRTTDEAVAHVESINQEYALHSKAARMLAERYFDSDIVLARLVQWLEETS
ncbi:MAG TPA: hypothetical protein VKP65_22520 [Rhodothermales bacterium]|nr:hypothetical protein [Rhodothermales bacterium]